MASNLSALDRLKKAANLEPVKKEVTLSDGSVFEMYVTPLTMAERERAQRQAKSDDANAFALQLLLTKAQDENGIRLFKSGEIDILKKIGIKIIIKKNSAIIKKGLHKKFEKIIGLIETAHGLNELKDIGQILNLERVGIGEVDFAADLGITEEEKYLEFYRSKLVYLSRLLNLPKPIGGVFKNFTDIEALENFAHELSKLGFGSMQLIHPNQIEVVKKVFTPSNEEIENARKLSDSISKNQDSGVGVFVNEKGDIVDAAMIRKAEEILNFIEKL